MMSGLGPRPAWAALAAVLVLGACGAGDPSTEATTATPTPISAVGAPTPEPDPSGEAPAESAEEPAAERTPLGAATAVPPTPASLVRLDPALIAVTASSEHPAGTFTYWADNTLDGDSDTAWNANEAWAGESITFRFAEAVTLGGIEIVNGYTRTAQSFAQNVRLEDIVVTTDAGDRVLRLADSTAAQRFDLESQPTEFVTISILSVYPGTTFDDAALTEVAFWVAPAA